jgi:hypothetical protein
MSQLYASTASSVTAGSAVSLTESFSLGSFGLYRNHASLSVAVSVVDAGVGVRVPVDELAVPDSVEVGVTVEVGEVVGVGVRVGIGVVGVAVGVGVSVGVGVGVASVTESVPQDAVSLDSPPL